MDQLYIGIDIVDYAVSQISRFVPNLERISLRLKVLRIDIALHKMLCDILPISFISTKSPDIADSLLNLKSNFTKANKEEK